MDFKQAWDLYLSKKDAYAKGNINDYEFSNFVSGCIVKDTLGYKWRIDNNNDKWMVLKAKKWIYADPATFKADFHKKILRISSRPIVFSKKQPKSFPGFIGSILVNYVINIPYTFLFQLMTFLAVFYGTKLFHFYILVILNDGLGKSNTNRWFWPLLNIPGLKNHNGVFYLVAGTIFSILLTKLFSGKFLAFMDDMIALPRWLYQCIKKAKTHTVYPLLFSTAVSLVASIFVSNSKAILGFVFLLFISLSTQKASIIFQGMKFGWNDIKKILSIKNSKSGDPIYVIINFGLLLGMILGYILYGKLLWIVVSSIILLLCSYLSRPNYIKSSIAMTILVICLFSSPVFLVVPSYADDGGWTESGKNLKKWASSDSAATAGRAGSAAAGVAAGAAAAAAAAGIGASAAASGHGGSTGSGNGPRGNGPGGNGPGGNGPRGNGPGGNGPGGNGPRGNGPGGNGPGGNGPRGNGPGGNGPGGNGPRGNGPGGNGPGGNGPGGNGPGGNGPGGNGPGGNGPGGNGPGGNGPGGNGPGGNGPGGNGPGGNGPGGNGSGGNGPGGKEPGGSKLGGNDYPVGDSISQDDNSAGANGTGNGNNGLDNFEDGIKKSIESATKLGEKVGYTVDEATGKVVDCVIKIKDGVEYAYDKVTGKAIDGLIVVDDVVDKATGKVVDCVIKIKDGVEYAYDKVTGKAIDGLIVVDDGVEKVTEVVVDKFGDVVLAVGDGVDKVTEIAEDKLGDVVLAVGDGVDKVTGVVEDKLGDAVLAVLDVGDGVNKVTGVVEDKFGDAVLAVGDGVDKVTGAVKDKLAGK